MEIGVPDFQQFARKLSKAKGTCDPKLDEVMEVDFSKCSTNVLERRYDGNRIQEGESFFKISLLKLWVQQRTHFQRKKAVKGFQAERKSKLSKTLSFYGRRL